MKYMRLKGLNSILFVWTFLYFPFWVYSQDGKIINFLLVSKEFAETTLSKYNKPLAEGLTYGVTGGWYGMANVQSPWKFNISLISNGTFIPKNKRSYGLDISNIENLEIVGGGNLVNVPTILGNTNSSVRMEATLDGRQFEFDVPTGIGLADLNLLPSALLQLSMGLPGATEVKIRYFPRISVDNIRIGLIGVGLQHEFSQWIEAMEKSKISLSAFIGYVDLSNNAKFDADGAVQGKNELIESNVKIWNYAILSSTHFPIYNVFLGLGYVNSKSKTELKGTFLIDTPIQSIIFKDPLTTRNNTSGVKLNIGGKARIGKRVSVILDYTFQGYNNMSFGLLFGI